MLTNRSLCWNFQYREMHHQRTRRGIIVVSHYILFSYNVIFKSYIENLSTESVEWPIRIAPCGGIHQSPINIKPTTAVVVDYPRLSFGLYDKVFPESVTNNGHTGRQSPTLMQFRVMQIFTLLLIPNNSNTSNSHERGKWWSSVYRERGIVGSLRFLPTSFSLGQQES